MNNNYLKLAYHTNFKCPTNIRTQRDPFYIHLGFRPTNCFYQKTLTKHTPFCKSSPHDDTRNFKIINSYICSFSLIYVYMFVAKCYQIFSFFVKIRLGKK